MDEKSKSEARRKKILDNAEARLRYIKEGIPWRTPEVINNEEPETEVDKNIEECSPSKKIDSCAEVLECSNTEEDYESITRVSDSPPEGLCISEEKVFDLISDCQTDRKLPESNEEFKNHEVEPPQPDSPSKSHINDRKLKESSTQAQRSILDSLNEEQTEPSNEPVQKYDEDKSKIDPFETLKALLNESTMERREHKQKALDQNRFAWISCFLMMCLGILVRISYAHGLSWVFNEMMLVPFVTFATPRLVSIARDPPAPSGTFAQALIMSGVKLKVINKAFTVVTLFRTFLQLFSVYLVSFLFTHQLAQTVF